MERLGSGNPAPHLQGPCGVRIGAERNDIAMRWATFQLPGSNVDRVGLVEGNDILALEVGVALLDLLGADGEILARAAERARAAADRYHLNNARLRPPIPRPPSVRDFYAFEQHVKTAREGRGQSMDPDWYELP